MDILGFYWNSKAFSRFLLIPWQLQIRETPHKRHHKFIEFYDVRAAEGALRALNRSDIAGKRIKLEPSRPGGARRRHVVLPEF
jgi:RNA recognition motif-containing protein